VAIRCGAARIDVHLTGPVDGLPTAVSVAIGSR
jgi:hypothetical protein